MAKQLQVIRSAKAQADVEDTLGYYLFEAPHAASRFLDALEKAVAHIQRSPGTGSQRYAIELDMPGLRFWSLNKFPFALFYLEQGDHLLVLRLVHMSRDIPATLLP